MIPIVTEQEYVKKKNHQNRHKKKIKKYEGFVEKI